MVRCHRCILILITILRIRCSTLLGLLCYPLPVMIFDKRNPPFWLIQLHFFRWSAWQMNDEQCAQQLMRSEMFNIFSSIVTNY